MSDFYIEAFNTFNYQGYVVFTNVCNTIISVIELLVYYYFFSQVLNNKTICTLTKTLRLIFIAFVSTLTALGFTYANNSTYISYFISSLEFLLLIPPCLTYFFELLKSDASLNFSRRPSFWIVTGICFYSGASIPFYLIKQFVFAHKYEDKYMMSLLFFYIPFTINLIFLG